MEYYPGTRRRIVPAPEQTTAPAAAPDPDAWDAHPRVHQINGVEVSFYPIGALAKALHRKPVTIRMWEQTGVLPRSLFRSRHDQGAGKARLYPRMLVEGLIEIAQDEGLFDGVPIASTRFTARAVELYHSVNALYGPASR